VLAALPIRYKGDAQASRTKGDNMTKLTPYLLFDGTCHKAMEFYQSIFGGELNLTKVKDSPAKYQMQAFQQEKVLNAYLKSGAIELSASDWLALSRKPDPTNTTCLFLNGGSLTELKELFAKLSEGAEVTNPLKEMFFGSYGALNDRFGVRWMFQTTSRD
jgi:PhnB protein